MAGTTRIQNPYRPGFNQAPVTLGGRADVIEDLIDALEIAAIDHRMPPPVMLVGPRGVGKTVLLGELADLAGRRFGWPRVHVEVRPGAPFTDDLLRSIEQVRALIEQAGPGGPRAEAMRPESATLRAQVAGVGGEVRFARPAPAADPRPLALPDALTSLARLAIEHDTGFVLTIDEMQLADRTELATLASLLQAGAGEDWPVATAGAGLPVMRQPEHAVTYFERATWHELGLLDPQESIDALEGPAEHAGRPLDLDAAERLALEAGGYPYAIQVYGHYAWRASDGQPRITLEAAGLACARAGRALAQGLYAGRWSAASPTQRSYLAAVARLVVDRTPATGRAVADHLGRTTRQLSSVRSDLLKQGTLTVDGDELRFTIPGMAEWVLEQPSPIR